MSEPDLNDRRQIGRVSWILVELFILCSHNNTAKSGNTFEAHKNRDLQVSQNVPKMN
jgi:hypothetical protein